MNESRPWALTNIVGKRLPDIDLKDEKPVYKTQYHVQHDFINFLWEQTCKCQLKISIFNAVSHNLPENLCSAYPEIGNSRFRCALWTFKQQLTLKMWARCGISIVLL